MTWRVLKMLSTPELSRGGSSVLNWRRQIRSNLRLRIVTKKDWKEITRKHFWSVLVEIDENQSQASHFSKHNARIRLLRIRTQLERAKTWERSRPDEKIYLQWDLYYFVNTKESIHSTFLCSIIYHFVSQKSHQQNPHKPLIKWAKMLWLEINTND